MRGLVLLLGISAFFGGLLLLYVGTSFFADFSTENITGPGVDVLLLDKYPGETGLIPLEIHARGGSRAGIKSIGIIKNNQVIRQFSGEGVTWSGTISSGKHRGDDEMIIEVPVKDVLDDDRQAIFGLDIYYVCAMSSGSYYENDTQHDFVNIAMPVPDGGPKNVSIFKDLLIVLSYFALWTLFWHLVLQALEKQADDLADLEKDAAYPALGFLITGGIIGYWIFATKIAALFGITGGWFVFLLMLVWLSGPVIAALPIRKRLKAKKFY